MKSKSRPHHRSIRHSQFRDNTVIHQGDSHIHLPVRPARALTHFIPYPRNEDFINRSDIVGKLDELLPPSSDFHSAALCGLGGSGKTQIALDYIYRRCGTHSVFWVHADTKATILHDYKLIARKFGGIDEKLDDEGLFTAVCNRIEEEPEWLLVLDNADDLSLFGVGMSSNSSKSLPNIIPRGPKGLVLWTTRDKRIMGTLVGTFRAVEVGDMSLDEAKILLSIAAATTPDRATSEDVKNINKLLESLQYHALAISQAGAYMRRTSTSVREYITMLAQKKKRQRILEKSEFDRHRKFGAPNSILETWSISIKRIRQESELAYNLFHTIAYFDNQKFSGELVELAGIESGFDWEGETDELEEAITRLKEFSLIYQREKEYGHRMYEMHKLVQEAARYRLRMEKPSENSPTTRRTTYMSEDLHESGEAQFNEADKKWIQLPDTPIEDEVCSWLLNLQQELLVNERAAYFRSAAENRVGTEAQRQLDLFVKLKRGEVADTKHDWKDVLVVGELKKTDKNSKALWLQIGSAVRNIFAAQPTRFFVHAFSLTGTEIETWVFDRSGPYSGAAFDINDEPDKFIQIMCGYLMMSDEEFGLDTFTTQKKNRMFVTIPVEPRVMKRKQKLELDSDPIAHQRAIVCRGTSCFRAKDINATESNTVVKFSWASSLRPPEADLLSKAQERGVKGLARMVGYCEEVISISKLREGLTFSTPHKFRNVPGSFSMSLSKSQPLSRSLGQFPGLSIASRKRKPADGNENEDETETENKSTYSTQAPQGTSLVQQNDAQVAYDNRILRVLAISPAGRCVNQFRSIPELLTCLCDAIKVHRSLYQDGKILHRDISENNIIITNPVTADGFNGMLIDLDLAKEEGKGPSGARHRTGTMEFMAIEVLLGTAHTYRHDLESSAASGKYAAEMVYGRLRNHSANKRGDMDRNGLETILMEFPDAFDCVKSLCRAVRDVLFPHRNGLFTGTPKDSELLYGPIIAAFEEAISDIRD
ncbi:hypothetical protein TrVGV298_002654 [Trichoderma virens]|nr:hypothetical protein TrVGV298_002654 [Trichoderma virens]